MFRLCLTDEDRKILRFVEDFGFITIHQCQNMYYNTQQMGYEMARKHLQKLVKYEKLDSYRDKDFNINMYYTDKKPSYHEILVLDYYSEIIKSGAKVHYFKKEQPWLDKKYFSDAYCVYSKANKVIFDIVEVVRTKSVEVEKYKEIYKSHEAHNLSQQIYTKLGGQEYDLFPHLIIIDDVKHRDKLFINDDIKTIQLDFKLTNITDIFI